MLHDARHTFFGRPRLFVRSSTAFSGASTLSLRFRNSPGPTVVSILADAMSGAILRYINHMSSYTKYSSDGFNVRAALDTTPNVVVQKTLYSN